MTISLLPLLMSPGKVTHLSHSLALTSEKPLIDDSLIPSFSELLAAPQHKKIAPVSTPRPEHDLTEHHDTSAPEQASTLLRLVTAMLPAEPPRLGQSPVPSSTKGMQETEELLGSETKTLPHTNSPLAMKKAVVTESLSQGATHQTMETPLATVNPAPTALASNTAQLMSQPESPIQKPLTDGRISQHHTAPPSLTQPATFPEVTFHSVSAQEIKAPLGSIQWQHDVSQQIIFHKQGQQTVHLKLHPEELGDVKISMTVDKGHAELVMLSNHSHVRAALEAALPQLRQALADNGIQLGNSQVGHDSTSGQQYSSSSNQSSPQATVMLPQGDTNEPASQREETPALLREGSKISLIV